ncbi:ABC-type transport system [Striga asiatica]|uniref:ABC-type transport system n=1 Tax=Striga asiatica TaxID=4170 RepID=A0A5A7PEH7_STRAF|nr:ABC-type transport system [Striga asiatica]
MTPCSNFEFRRTGYSKPLSSGGLFACSGSSMVAALNGDKIWAYGSSFLERETSTNVSSGHIDRTGRFIWRDRVDQTVAEVGSMKEDAAVVAVGLERRTSTPISERKTNGRSPETNRDGRSAWRDGVLLRRLYTNTKFK